MSDDIWSDEAAQVSERVDKSDGGGCGGFGQKGGRQSPKAGQISVETCARQTEHENGYADFLLHYDAKRESDADAD